MFTGIIREIGTVARRERSRGVIRVTIAAPRTARRVQRLESVAVNGVCLSVVAVRRDTLLVEVIRETQRLTTLGSLERGSRVNLEPSLSLTDRLNGHVVLGHVDGTGAVSARRAQAGELVLTIRLASALRRRLVPKGPVTVDGVSLTVGRSLTPSTFSVHLIPETLRQTTLASRRVGDRVNIEVDYFAKLVQQFLRGAA
jgi:riboflavin synthase